MLGRANRMRPMQYNLASAECITHKRSSIVKISDVNAHMDGLKPQQGIAPTRVRFRTNNCVKNVKWLKEEDEQLMQIMSSRERPNYSQLAQLFPGKTGQQVAERWDKVLNPSLLKGSWTRQEDETIIEFVKLNGTKKWQKLSLLLPGRIGKQCRERWRNHLDPAINHDPWTPEEDLQLIELHKEHGNSWVKIASLMHNRSDNAVKNRWNSTLRKKDTAPPVQSSPIIIPKTKAAEESEVSGPPSSPFVSFQTPLSFFSPVLSNSRANTEQDSGTTLAENREELLKLILK